MSALMTLLFDVVFIIYSLLYLPYLILTRRWHKGFAQRLGFLDTVLRARLNQTPNIWVHAVSVGEVMAIEGLVARLKERYPHFQIVTTVTTKTGHALAMERLSRFGPVITSPLDMSFIVHVFIAAIKPKMYIGAETEIWPNLFAFLHRNKVPICIVNGRISDKSFPRYQAIAPILKSTLNKVSVWCMQSALDQERILKLGASQERVFCTGNIKFDEAKLGEVKQSVLKAVAPVWICGSTHPGEEEIILNVYKKVVSPTNQWHLILAPRHIERISEILDLLKANGLSAVKYSTISGDLPLDHVVVVDTIGHLKSLYQIADLVFVGKSLCVGGGHNIIEPAFFAKAMVVGPRMENFRDIVSCFTREDAIVMVDEEKFLPAVEELMRDKRKRQEIGTRARGVVESNQGAIGRILEHIREILS